MQLRQLLISGCYEFQGFPKSIGHLKHLQKIVITAGYNANSLPDEFCLLQSLEHLVFKNCDNLSSLPNNFGNLRNLRHLCLSKCTGLRRLPLSFKNLVLLQHLNLQGCSELTFALEEDLNFLENITKLEYLNLSFCRQLEELPRHITNQASLRELYFNSTCLRKLPEDIGQLSRLREMKIEYVPLASLPNSLGDLSNSLTKLSICYCPELKCLPDTLGDLSSLTNLLIHMCNELECLPDTLGYLSSLTYIEIGYCAKLKCLPDTLGELSLLTNLYIAWCPKLESEGVKSLPKSIRQLNNLQKLTITECPISALEFGLSKLKKIYVEETEVCRISFSENCCPFLESLRVYNNHHLEEIEALPRTLQSISLENCEMLKSIPSFAGFTSLTNFQLTGCTSLHKIEGLENCTSLQELTVETCWEMAGIESLENMQNLKWLQLKANKGSVIELCIQGIQKWPEEGFTCARAVPDAASLVDSLLSPNLVNVDSFSNQNIEHLVNFKRNIKSMVDLELMTRSGDGAFMFCIVINCFSSEIFINMGVCKVKVEKGRWALVGVFPQGYRKMNFQKIRNEPRRAKEAPKQVSGEGEVEKGLVLRGEEQIPVDAVHSLLPIFLQS